MLVSSTPEPPIRSRPPAKPSRSPACPRFAPWQPWFIGQQGNPGDPASWKPFNYAYHFFWGLEDIIAVFTGMWGQVETNKKVGGLFRTTATAMPGATRSSASRRCWKSSAMA